MLNRSKFFIYIFVLLCTGSYAQDIHFSQFFNAPLNLNPALTGAFNGDQRFHLNYRNQWTSVPVDYVSADIGADFKFRTKDNNYYAIGALINYDQAGDLNLNMTGLNLFLAYGMQVSSKVSISPAFTISYAQRRFDANAAITGNQWDGRSYNPTIPAENIGVDNNSYFDLGAGINVRHQTAYRNFLNFGVGAYHLISPNDGFVPNQINTARPIRLTVNAQWNYPIATQMDIILSGLYATQEVYQEIIGNAQLKFYLGKRQNTALYLGAGYRLDDAWYPMIGLDFGQFYGAFSYDFNISDFDVATDGRGGPEFTLRYILARIPQGLNKPCPLY